MLSSGNTVPNNYADVMYTEKDFSSKTCGCRFKNDLQCTG